MSLRRGAFLLAGWLVVGVALSPPLDAAADEKLTAHMVQHMLLLAVAAPLLVLGEPIRFALDLLSPAGARRLAGGLRWRPLSLLLQPLVALALLSLVVVLTHLPAVYDTALGSPPLHALEHASYLFAGAAFWAAALGADPTARPLDAIALVGLLTAAMVPMVAIGTALATASGVVYPHYAAVSGATEAIAEQHPAATAMWAGDLPFAAAIVLAGWAAVRREERAQRLRELAAGREKGRV
jgi:putative membrane protein